MDNLERRFGKYAVRNLTMVLIILYAAGYLIAYIRSDILYMLTLDPYAIVHGQIWRLVTWLVVPPGYSNLLTVAVILYCYYSIGHSLEQIWGTWRYNVFVFRGILLTILSAFLWMGFTYLFGAVSGNGFALIGEAYFSAYSVMYSTYYINLGIILAFALTFPDAHFLLFFLIPVKAKYIAAVDAAYLLYGFIRGTAPGRFAILATAANLVIFWFTRPGRVRGGMSYAQRKMWHNAAQGKSRGIDGLWNDRQGKPFGKQETENRPAKDSLRAGQMVHRCAVCGRTNIDHPDLEFRFCSKCEGGMEYCQDHLFTHVHVKKGERPTLKT